MTIHLHKGDLPGDLLLGDVVAVDTETMGLKPVRDRLCLVQLSAGNGDCHLVHFAKNTYAAPHLGSMLANPNITKIFHYGRFDMAMLKQYLGVLPTAVFCTKIASRLTRTYTDRHGLKDLCKELLDVDLSKQQQSSDWGAPTLSEVQKEYAASDVLYLHALKDKLEEMLAREGRGDIAAACFRFLPTRVMLDLNGWHDADIFSHS